MKDDMCSASIELGTRLNLAVLAAHGLPKPPPSPEDYARDWPCAWMHEDLWWKLALGGHPNVTAQVLHLEEMDREYARDPEAWNRKAEEEMRAAMASLGDPIARWARDPAPLDTKAAAEAIRGLAAAFFDDLPAGVDGVAAVMARTNALAECFRCGHTVFTEAEIGETCTTEGCTGRYVRG